VRPRDAPEAGRESGAIDPHLRRADHLDVQIATIATA
jgi:hypothetical protein